MNVAIVEGFCLQILICDTYRYYCKKCTPNTGTWRNHTPPIGSSPNGAAAVRLRQCTSAPFTGVAPGAAQTEIQSAHVTCMRRLNRFRASDAAHSSAGECGFL